MSVEQLEDECSLTPLRETERHKQGWKDEQRANKGTEMDRERSR